MTIPGTKAPRQQKRLLFLHPNFPAQFKHLACAGAKQGYDVRFLCQTHYGRSIPGVQRLKLKGSCGHNHLNALGGNILERSANLASQYRQGLLSLKASGWHPDIVISHSGWGCGLHIKEVWPTCRHIAYLEWWFDPQSDFLNYDEENHELGLHSGLGGKLWLRNQALALELVTANEIVAPTSWQAQQLPALLKGRCHVIHDGIDLDQFKPAAKQRTKEQLTITYGTRGMEPMRGFPQFIKSLLNLLPKNKNIRAQIAGVDEICYGGKPPKNHATWGTWAKTELRRAGLAERVEWLGHLGTKSYIAWLQASDCHVHLTHPFVASWSLLEALACQCPMVVSDVAPARELCEVTKSKVAYVDHRHDTELPEAILSVLLKATEASPIAPSQGLRTYCKQKTLEQWSHVAGLQLTTDH